MNSNNNKGRSGSHRIALPTIIAYNSTEQAQRLITTKFGYPRARNVKELELRLAQIIKGFPDGLKTIAQIHPDKDLILQYNAPNMMEGGVSNGNYYNSSGLPPDTIYVPSWAGTTPTLMAVEDWGDVRIKTVRGGYDSADGSNFSGKKIIGAGGIILGVLALGTLLVAFGEKKRSFSVGQ
jgi:hypothetical protein